MEGFTIVDGGAAIVLLLSAILAYSRGFVREILSIAGWVVAAIVAFIFAPQVEPLVAEVPVLSNFLSSSCELSMIVAFTAVFALTLIIVAIFTPLFAGAVQRSALSGFDQGLGFLFGIARGIVLILVALILYQFIIPGDEGIPMVEQSKTKELLAGTQAQAQEALPTEESTNWLMAKYAELTTSCNGGTTPNAETPSTGN